MTLFSVPPAKTFHLLASLAASAALLGCSGARNGASNSDALAGAAAAKAMPMGAQAQPPASFVMQGIEYFTPTIAQDSHGNRIAVWAEFDGQRFNIWAKRSAAGLGWSGSQQLDVHNDGDAYSPRIAFDLQGNAMAVWEQQTGGRFKVWANRYVAGRGWGAAQAIDSMDSAKTISAYAPQVALNAVGEAVAVWQHSDGHHAQVRTSRYLPGAGWGDATRLGNATTYASAPQVAFDARGIAVAVWQQFDGQQTRLWASQQNPGGGWAHAVQLGIGVGAGDALNPSLAVDALGRVNTLWQLVNGTSSTSWAQQYSASVGWGRPSLLKQQSQAHIDG